MSQIHVDHPGEMSWFVGHGPAPVIGPCPHADCPHTYLSDIAWGPSNERYCLVSCDAPEGCNEQCRAWTTEYDPYEASKAGVPRFRTKEFQQVDLTREQKRTKEDRHVSL